MLHLIRVKIQLGLKPLRCNLILFTVFLKPNPSKAKFIHKKNMRRKYIFPVLISTSIYYGNKNVTLRIPHHFLKNHQTFIDCFISLWERFFFRVIRRPKVPTFLCSAPFVDRLLLFVSSPLRSAPRSGPFRRWMLSSPDGRMPGAAASGQPGPETKHGDYSPGRHRPSDDSLPEGIKPRSHAGPAGPARPQMDILYSKNQNYWGMRYSSRLANCHFLITFWKVWHMLQHVLNHNWGTS